MQISRSDRNSFGNNYNVGIVRRAEIRYRRRIFRSAAFWNKPRRYNPRYFSGSYYRPYRLSFSGEKGGKRVPCCSSIGQCIPCKKYSSQNEYTYRKNRNGFGYKSCGIFKEKSCAYDPFVRIQYYSVFGLLCYP